MTATSMTGGYARGRATKREILDTALQTFAEVGYNGASLREIAARCGITHPGLIHHFPTKAALLAAVLERRDEEDAEHFALASGQPTDLLRSLVQLMAFNATRRSIVELYASLSAEASSESHPAHEFFKERYRRIRSAVRGALEEARDAGMLREGVDPAAAATAIVAMMDGLQVQWLIEPESVDMAEIIGAAVERIVVPVSSSRES